MTLPPRLLRLIVTSPLPVKNSVLPTCTRTLQRTANGGRLLTEIVKFDGRPLLSGEEMESFIQSFPIEDLDSRRGDWLT
jgi:hypothetical protein